MSTTIIRCVRKERIQYLQDKLKRIEAALHPEKLHRSKDPRQTRRELSWLHASTSREIGKLQR